MQKALILAIAIAVAAASVNHQKYQDTHTVLAEIDQDAFGNLILSQIKTLIQTKSPVDEVNMLLNQIIASIIQDQSAHDQMNRTDQAACDRITTDLENNIHYHNSQISANTQLRDDTVEALAATEADLRQVIQDIANNEATYAREEATRNQQHSVWETKDGQHAEAIEAVDEASKLIQHLSLGASFAQVKTKYETVQKRLNEQSAHEALFRPIIAALTELSTHVDQKALTRISQLLAQLRQQLVEARGVLQETEDRQAAHWVEFSEHLTNEHSRLVERKQALESQISAYKTTIEDCNELLEFHTLELEVVEEGLAGQNTWCTAQEELYAVQTKEREWQQDVLQRVQEHLVEKLAATAQFLASRK